MRHYITFSLCDETGEADLTPKSRKLLTELAASGELIAADWLGDMHGITESLYSKSVDAWQSECEDKWHLAQIKNNA